MLIFDYTDFTQNTTEIFDAALTNEVIVIKDKNRYKILPIKNENQTQTGKSPLEDIPYIEADITTQEIVELLRESRAGI
jgi:hypothetical protein